MNIPKAYRWLAQESAPRHLLKAIELYGVTESVGNADNPVILGWAKDLGLGKVYTSDSIPWCLDGETLISTLDGYKFIKDIKEGLDFVYTKEKEFHLVNKVLTRKKQLHKVYITGCLPLLVSSEHPFLIKKCKKYNYKKKCREYEDDLKWVEFKDIQKGDLLCKLKGNVTVKSFLDEMPESFIQLLGTYAAEGTSRKAVKGDATKNIKSRSACCHIHIGKHELNHIKDLILISGIKKYTITERRTCYQIEIRDKEFVELCSQIGHKGIEKRIPYFVLNGTDYVKFSFLKGYLDGDGYFNKETKRGSVSSISKVLIQGVGKLLSDQGIFPTFREELRKGIMKIEDRVVNIKDRYIIQYVKNQNNAKQYLEDKDYYYLPIRKVIHNFKEDLVYDLEVEEVSNFLANDLVVHNCGLYVGVVILRAGRPVVKDPLWALNWNNFGVKVGVPMLGDVLTFTRKSGGHVGFYIGEDSTAYHVLGGNQGNKVSIVRIAKSRLSQARRPEYNSQPTNIRKVILANNGLLSTNEA